MVIFFVRSNKPYEQPLFFIVDFNYHPVCVPFDVEYNTAILKNTGTHIGLLYFIGCSPG